ncbi:MAG: GSCFA domain-containing protein [Bacteroidota bacterium]
MKLQTHVSIAPESNQIDYSSKILLLGSCFATSMGERLEYFKFQNMQNPFGVIFNPVSLAALVHRAVNEEYFIDDDVFEKEGQWLCFETHSSVTAPSREALLELMNSRLKAFREFLSSATHVVITYGTSWVYRHKDSGKIVANCHKVPQHIFSKELLSMEDCERAMEEIATNIRSINPDAVLIGTVSPVRHVKDGLANNTRSKARLILALHATSGYHYFPAYELMMDELRDYRFYDKDLLHPSELAVDIIWDRFRSAWVAAESLALQKEIDGIQKALRHRPFVPNSEAHRSFEQSLQQKIKKISNHLPHVRFDT